MPSHLGHDSSRVEGGTETTTPSTPTAAAFTLPVLCPLCFSAPVTDPVLLHTAPTSAKGVGCVACRECAENWAPLFAYRGESSCALPACPQCAAAPIAAGAGGFPSVVDMVAPPKTLANPFVVAAAPQCSDDVVGGAVTGDGSLDLAGWVAKWRVARRTAADEARQAANEEEASSKEEEEPLCGVCEEAKGPLLCLQCDFALCVECQAATHSKGRFKLHEVLPVADAREAKRRTEWQTKEEASASTQPKGVSAAATANRKCSLHRQQFLDLYCRTCSVCICVTCCFGGDHKGDDVVPLADYAQQCRASAASMPAEMAETAREAAATHAGLTALLPQYAAVVAGVEAQVRSAFAALRDALAQREAQVVEQLLQSSRGVEGGIACQARLSGSISAAAAGSERRLGAFLSSADSVTLMDLLSAVTAGHAQLRSLAARLSGDAAHAQSSLSGRLSGARTAGPVAALHLFPKEAADNAAAVAEYAALLSSLGQLTTQATFPAAVDMPAPKEPTPAPVVEEEEPETEEEEEEEVVDISPQCVTAPERHTREVTAPAPVPVPVPVPVPAAAAPKRNSQAAVEEALVVGSSPLYIISRDSSASLRKPSAPTAAIQKSQPLEDLKFQLRARSTSERGVPATLASLDASSRRTEVHSLGGAQRTSRLTEDWPMFGPGGSARTTMPAADVNADTSGLGRKRQLDLSFDRLSTNDVARFSNTSVQGATVDGPLARQTFEWEPVAKMARIDSAMDGFRSLPKSNTISISREEHAVTDDMPKSNTATGFNLQLRL